MKKEKEVKLLFCMIMLRKFIINNKQHFKNKKHFKKFLQNCNLKIIKPFF